MASDSGGNVGEAIGAILLGIIGGVALGAILEALIKPQCPICKKPLEQGIEQCPNCHTMLRWN